MVSLLRSFLFIYLLITSRKKPIETPNCVVATERRRWQNVAPKKLRIFFHLSLLRANKTRLPQFPLGVHVDNVVSVSCPYQMYV